MTPLLLLFLSTVAQFALYEHAEHVATSAAQEGLAAARVQGGSVEAGQQRASAVIHDLGSGLLTDPHVVVVLAGGQARADVAGYAEQLVPFLRIPIDVSATGPVEPSGNGP